MVSWSTCSSQSRWTLAVYCAAADTAAAVSSPIQCMVPVTPLAMLYMVTPCSTVWTPTFRNNVQQTFSKESSLERHCSRYLNIHYTASCYRTCRLTDSKMGTFLGLPDGLPGQLPPLLLSQRLKLPFSNVCMSMLRFLDVCQCNQYQPPVHSACQPRLVQLVPIRILCKSHTFNTQLRLPDNH